MKLFAFALLFLSFESMASNVCAPDAKKFCSSVEPGKGQLARCLQDYEGSLSAACAKELKNFKSKSTKMNPCFEDLTELCADLPTDPHNYELCLLKYESRLSPTCSADFKQKKGKIITRDVCAQDIANNCFAEVSAPEGAITRCLIRNRTKLSGFCQKRVDQKIAQLKKDNPCFDDTEKLCPKAVKFIEIQDCLSQKSNLLAPQCKNVVQAESMKMQKNPCYRDLVTHCKMGLSPADQNRCLTVNENELSNACKQFRVVESGKIDKMVQMCENDRLKLCPKVPFKNGQVVKCLRSMKAQVSPGCKQFL